MENKEQSTQNSPMGMESVTTSMPAIDGNEKQMIEMLNQPTILPNAVKVESKTKVGQPSAAPEDRVPEDEILPEIVNDEELEEDEEAEDVELEVEGKTKEELAAMLEEIVQEPDVMKIKDQVTAIRVHFMKLNKEDMDKEFEAFLEDGGDKDT